MDHSALRRGRHEPFNSVTKRRCLREKYGVVEKFPSDWRYFPSCSAYGELSLFSACPNQTRPFAVFSVTVFEFLLTSVSFSLTRAAILTVLSTANASNSVYILPVIAVRVRCQATLCILLECFLDHVHLDTWRQIRHHSDGFPTDQARWIPNCGEWILFEGVFLAIISFSQWIVHWDRQRWRDGWGKQLSLNPVNHMTAQKRQQAAILRSEAPSLKTWFIRDKVRDSHSIRLWLLAIALLMCRAQSYV